MTEELTALSDEQLRSLFDRTQQELARREEQVRRAIRAEFDDRLERSGLTLADIYPEISKEFAPQREKKPGARMIARALFLIR
jgi:hypothetical protein